MSEKSATKSRPSKVSEQSFRTLVDQFDQLWLMLIPTISSFTVLTNRFQKTIPSWLSPSPIQKMIIRKLFHHTEWKTALIKLLWISFCLLQKTKLLKSKFLSLIRIKISKLKLRSRAKFAIFLIICVKQPLLHKRKFNRNQLNQAWLDNYSSIVRNLQVQKVQFLKLTKNWLLSIWTIGWKNQKRIIPSLNKKTRGL